MDPQKIYFLQTRLVPLIKDLKADSKGKWGVMNAQQMIEHYSESLRIANGKATYAIHTPKEHLKKYHDFLMSEKPFKENTKNPIMSDTPPPIKNAIIQQAIDELQQELNDFFTVFALTPGLITTHPIFGALNFDENVQLLYKHAQHHLKQFGLD